MTGVCKETKAKNVLCRCWVEMIHIGLAHSNVELLETFTEVQFNRGAAIFNLEAYLRQKQLSKHPVNA